MEITNIAELFSENIFALQNITNSKNNSKRGVLTDSTVFYFRKTVESVMNFFYKFSGQFLPFF